MAIPEGWTDDMTIPLPPGLAVEEIVELILRAWGEGAEYATTIEKLVSLGLPEEDACLAYDRTHGGRVRAETGSMANEPRKEKDPIAWVSFHRNLGKATASDASSMRRATRSRQGGDGGTSGSEPTNAPDAEPSNKPMGPTALTPPASNPFHPVRRQTGQPLGRRS